MQTHFITLEVGLEAMPDRLQQAILSELQKHGEPLRWAIVAVGDDRTVTVEAVVTAAAEFLISAQSVRVV